MDLQTSSSPLSSPTPEMLSAFLKQIEQEQTRRRTENRLAHSRAYPKQREFHAAGASAREQLLMADNQLGKTLAGRCATRYALMCLRFARPAGARSFTRKLHCPPLGVV